MRTKHGAIFGLHVVVALHAAHRCFQNGETAVGEMPTGCDEGLFSDHPLPMDLFDFSVAIRDQPVAMRQLCSFFTGIVDGDVVGEDVPLYFRIRILFKKCGLHLYFDGIGVLGHIASIENSKALMMGGRMKTAAKAAVIRIDNSFG